MQFWNNIIQNAMLGTDKQTLRVDALPAELAVAATSIDANEAIDKEEKFLQLTALAFSFRQAGAMPFHNATADLPPCPPEEKNLCSTKAMQVLRDLQYEDGTALLQMWLQNCVARHQLVHPIALPQLLDIAVQHKQLRSLVTACAGHRGAWLSQFNPQWNFSQAQTPEQQWQTGHLEQRKTILHEVRTSDAALALQWVQQTWAQEDAAAKVAFLEILRSNLSEAELPFLESLATEKSKKVKELALQLKKLIPTAPVIQLYQRVLSETVVMKTEKTMLGLSSKTSLQLQLPAEPDAAIFNTGIEKLSNQKGYTDEEWIIFQLIAAVPPAFWSQQLGLDPLKILALFEQDPGGSKMTDAFVAAAINFTDQDWGSLFTRPQDVFRADLLPLLSPVQQEAYCLRFFQAQPHAIIQFVAQRQQEWSMELALEICRFMAANPYNYNRSFFHQQIACLPLRVVELLDRCTPKEEHLQPMWINTSAYINKLVALKTQIIKAFHV